VQNVVGIALEPPSLSKPRGVPSLRGAQTLPQAHRPV
jgi:hypothetical protein